MQFIKPVFFTTTHNNTDSNKLVVYCGDTCSTDGYKLVIFFGGVKSGEWMLHEEKLP